MRTKWSKIRCLLLVLSLFSLFIGCTATELEADINHTTVVINADGTVRAVFVEDFSQAYYDIEGLRTMVTQEIADYNAANGADRLILDECTKVGNTARVGITYASVDDYAAYQETVLYAGTISGAIAAGYSLDINLTAVKDGAQIGLTEIGQMGDKHIVIMEEAPRIRVYKKILYIGSDIVYINPYEADASENVDMTYIIFK